MNDKFLFILFHFELFLTHDLHFYFCSKKLQYIQLEFIVISLYDNYFYNIQMQLKLIFFANKFDLIYIFYNLN